jgi:hypothetical protein
MAASAAAKTYRGFPYLGIGMYSTHLDRFREFFPSNQILVLRFEDFVADSLHHIDTVCRFLQIGLGHVPSNVDRVANPFQRGTSVVRSRSVLMGSFALRALSRATLYHVSREAYVRLGGTMKRLHKSHNVVTGSPSPESESLLSRLADFFASDSDRLSEEFGVRPWR